MLDAESRVACIRVQTCENRIAHECKFASGAQVGVGSCVCIRVYVFWREEKEKALHEYMHLHFVVRCFGEGCRVDTCSRCYTGWVFL